ncbi:zinc finger BED domain-containing protein DAYSLEEPER-like [Triticum dicoccoides]|uniref:zinc finger BED domain-containing protein DAYSLEEPER-like n=1 Tax=Triticum dicoccoides TaxID=85692 RepID=UPI000E7972A7|nr:zinc finger BED domain-containing protein DAYSLEEPER-like [Triticum dicoccoides]
MKTDPHVPAESTGGQAVAVKKKKQGRKRKPRSDVWEHFEPFTNSDGEERARCRRCGLGLAADTSRNGTSRLRRHAQGSCPGSPPPPPPPKPLAAAAQSQSLDCSSKPADSNWKEATADLARMIASHSYDPSFVEDSSFRSFVCRLNPGFEVPSRDAIQLSCDGIFEETMRVLESELERTSGQVNLALDAAETAQGTVLYVACHFIDEGWHHRQMIIDAYLVAPEYMSRMPLLGTGGVVLHGTDRYNVLVERISSHSVLHRLFSITVGRIGGLRPYLQKASFQAVCGGVSCCCGDTYADTLLCSVAEDLCDNLRSHPFASDAEETVEGEPGLEFEELRSQLDFDCRLPYHKKWYSCYSSLQVFQKYSSSEFDKLLCRLWRGIDRATKTISDLKHRPS